MKLLCCLECSDIFSLSRKLKTCSCKKTKGQYIDDINAEISGTCQPIGFENKSFKTAYKIQLIEDANNKEKATPCEGILFDAFFIPESATSVKRI